MDAVFTVDVVPDGEGLALCASSALLASGSRQDGADTGPVARIKRPDVKRCESIARLNERNPLSTHLTTNLG
jgi:hypothetical protein